MITKASEIKGLIKSGWELWYVGHKSGNSKIPGNWHMRYQAERKEVSWDAIERCRKNLSWWESSTDEIQVGKNWIYRLKQRDLLASSASSGSRKEAQ
ncbi:hypothetical protein [Marinobacter sp. Hex_13]|uniref:hypothetical protein n=1 Tax=Marinobacter sp. Hex_13 TaxID=1795866 RepID=UPI00079296E3|nr:hypothetical protein [Marinobacter sp. Hex_13]KXJ45841.1 MAG: hypothetical protein AXW11_12175 [Marinobacter sp. Hex_13]